MQDIDENDSILCVGDCNFEVGRETRQSKDGRLLIEMVERCTRCGYVFARNLVSDRLEKN
jgi:predicted Zn-ribbon and HTH transcriptional regulator